MKSGIITGTIDAATVVVVFIETGGGIDRVTADGNLWRRAEALCGPLASVAVEYERTSWGGLTWFHPLTTPSANSG